MEVSGQFHAQIHLLLGKEPRYPLERSMVGPQNRSGRGGVENSQTLPGLEPPIIHPVAIPAPEYSSLCMNNDPNSSLVSFLFMHKYFPYHFFLLKLFIYFLS